MKLFIYGCGCLGKEIFEAAFEENKKSRRWSEVMFLDDAYDGDVVYGADVFSLESALLENCIDDFEVIIASGDPAIREIMYNKLVDKNARIISYIDETVRIPNSVVIGLGSVIMRGSIISINVVLGKCILINNVCVVSHDVNLEDFVCLSPAVALGGNIKIGARTFVGISSCIKNNVEIGERVIIGMGSVVVKSIPNYMIAYGNPATIKSDNKKKTIFINA